MLTTVSSLLQQPLPQGQKPLVSLPVINPRQDVKEETKENPSAQESTFGGDRFIRYGRTAGLVGGSGVAAYRLGEKTGFLLEEAAKALQASNGNIQAALPSIKNVLGAGLQGAGISAMVSAGISTAVNIVAATRGDIDKSTAFSNVFSDSISGAMAGFGGVAAAGAGNILMRSMGMVGLPLTIVTTVLGVAGGVATGKLSEAMSKPLSEADLST